MLFIVLSIITVLMQSFSTVRVKLEFVERTVLELYAFYGMVAVEVMI